MKIQSFERKKIYFLKIIFSFPFHERTGGSEKQQINGVWLYFNAHILMVCSLYQIQSVCLLVCTQWGTVSYLQRCVSNSGFVLVCSSRINLFKD